MKFGLQVGYNHSKFTKTKFSPNPIDGSYKTSWLRGFNIGVVTEIEIAKDLYLQPGILLQGKGTHLSFKSSFDTSSRFIEVHYVELPVRLKFKTNWGKNMRAITSLGFYGSKSIRGVEKGSGTSYSGPYAIYNKVEFSNKNENQKLPTIIKPFDFGYSLLLGVEIKKFQLFTTFCQSFNGITPNEKIYNGNFKNSTVSLSVTYFIIDVAK
jgi:hypothetical protein